MKTALVIPQLKASNNQKAAIRTAEALGVSEVLLIGNQDVESFNRVTRGTQRHINFKYFNNNEDCVKYLIQNKYKIVCIENDNNANSLLNFKFPAKCALVMGNENKGVPKEYLNLFNSIHLKIPQFSVIPCMNTSVAMGIVMYERFKQRLMI